MLGHQQPVIPDYIRCGSALYYVTWPRLVTVCVAALLLAVGFSELQEHMPVESELSSDRASYGAGGGAPPRYDGGGIRGLLGKAASRLVKGGGGGGGKGGAAADRPPVMPSWCKNKHGSLYFLEKWKLAFLSEGSKDYPLTDAGRPDAADADAAGATDGAGQKLCDWVPATKMQVEFPFSLCTFDRTVDTQVSAFVHKDGVWNNGKREVRLRARHARERAPVTGGGWAHRSARPPHTHPLYADHQLRAIHHPRPRAHCHSPRVCSCWSSCSPASMR